MQTTLFNNAASSPATVGITTSIWSLLVLALMLAIAVYTELKENRIPNWLTLSGMAVGLFIAYLHGRPAIGSSLAGLLIGFVFLFVFYVFGGIGGGDVKLMGAAGALMGGSLTLPAIFYTAMTGFFMGILMLIWRRDSWTRLGAGLRRLAFWRKAPHRHRPRAIHSPFPTGSPLRLAVCWRCSCEEISKGRGDCMNRREHTPGMVKDERGQALTEFAIVIPVVLLFFFAMVQYFLIVQAAQLGNYAAYMAGRVYAVQASVAGGEKAKETAHTAAAMALAPIARLVPGETRIFGTDLSAFGFSSLESFVGNKLARYADGYVAAKYLRLQPNVLGGSVNITTSGDPLQVDVGINYPQPIYVPGLAPLWNFVAGDKIFTGMRPLREGLEGIPATYADYQTLREELQKFADELGLDVVIPDPSSSLISFCPYVNVRSKCSMGFEEWGNKNGQPHDKYRPRMPKDE